MAPVPYRNTALEETSYHVKKKEIRTDLAQVVCVGAAHHAGPYAIVASLRNEGVGQAGRLPALHVRLDASLPQLNHVRSL